MDHDGGLAHFPNSEILVAPGELRTASGWAGRIRGYLPNRWPSWFDPSPLKLMEEPFGPFARSRQLTRSGDVIAVATPGHTADHISVVVQEDDATVFLAGDTSYNEILMLAGTVDGVSTTEQTSKATLDAIRHFTQVRPTTYLPTHDPQSAIRLANRCRVTAQLTSLAGDEMLNGAKFEQNTSLDNLVEATVIGSRRALQAACGAATFSS
jgi:glyoxylase-like metal-dependent hydrolase (beta-lactamase superfamily II)